MDTLSLFTRLAAAKRILLAGAGGGFDVMSGLPLAFALRRLGKTVHLANLTFSYLGASDAPQIAPHLYEVRPDTASEERYFPEKHLAAHLGESIHCIEKVGVAPMREVYRSRFGDRRSVPRIADATKPLFINPLMSLIWTFELGAVARRCLYAEHVASTCTIFEVGAAIEAFRKTADRRPRRALPM